MAKFWIWAWRFFILGGVFNIKGKGVVGTHHAKQSGAACRTDHPVLPVPTGFDQPLTKRSPLPHICGVYASFQELGRGAVMALKLES